MNNPILSSSKAVQYTTFFCNRAVLGLDISYVQEINRTVNLTRVPLSPPCVRGVMNLRGEVVTMLDLRILMGLPAGEPSKLSRNLILKYEGEVFGLWVDGVADILTIENVHCAATFEPFDDGIATDSRRLSIGKRAGDADRTEGVTQHLPQHGSQRCLTRPLTYLDFAS